MKPNRTLLLLLLIFACIGLSCNKEGLQGPDGAQGPTGPAGANGVAGPAGKDGSVIYSGNGAPAATLGANSDYYLDKTTDKLYGPKTAGAWGAPIDLKGANGTAGAAGTNGAQGAAGSQILSGAGAPNAALGKGGDFYLDKTNTQLYGPKNTSWGSPVLLMGAQGIQGPVGPAGKDGSVIYSGIADPDPTLGKVGDYYFTKSSSSLFGPKTAAGWGARTSLAGATGANGRDGATILSGTGGPANTLGKVGDFYLDITNYGLYGPKTLNGWGTRTILQGAQGAQGPVGPAGADGSIIYSGTTDPDPTLGKNGDYYFNKTNGSLFGPKTTGGWGARTFLNGATGATGADGATVLSGTGVPANTFGKIGDFYLDVATYGFYGAKTASGWGPRTILKGAQGAQGPIGPAGADGSIIYSGTADPDPALGKNGDYYINKSNRALFGPKTAAGWGTPTSLTGPAGANGSNGTNGTDGATILSGFQTPDASIGRIGDFYINTQTFFFYGPKNVDGWGRGLPLRTSDGSTVTAYETSDETTFNWILGDAGGNTLPTSNYFLRQFRPLNDTSSFFRLPQTQADAVNHGIVLVYLHVPGAAGTSTWVQLSYTNNPTPFAVQYYNYKAVVDDVNGVYVRITCTAPSQSTRLTVDKVRIVITPQTATGTIGLSRGQSISQTMRQFHLTERDFVKLH